jgi:uncharacterized protein YyaL (SSP411 family)
MRTGLAIAALLVVTASAAAQERKTVASDALLGDAAGAREGAGRRPNGLAFEKSLYLREHAYNPVDWRPWGDAALDEAKRREVPIFLSIGYSSCHWCHVMARESFEDPDVAKLLNERFVPVKVDREENPDVDAAYIRAVEAIHGSAGWPLSVFLEPNGKPFYGGTYFPREPFLELLHHVDDLWRTRRRDLEGDVSRLEHLLSRTAPRKAGATIDEALLDRAAEAMLAQQDPLHGGEGTGSKFPRAPSIAALLDLGRARPAARAAALATLDAIVRGGIHDHLGGGFHRYTVDREWRVPHFEKTLYDQALLASVLVDAWRATMEDRWARAARAALDYALRDLRLESGGFASAEDADSPGGEGRFYTWTREEVGALGLEPATAELACRRFAIEAQGKGNLDGRSVLRLADAQGDVARIESAVAAMREARAARARPARDDKAIAGWNGLMITALAKAGAALGEPRYVEAARTTARVVLEKLRGKNGRLLRRLAGGRPGELKAALEDHAYVAAGLLDLYEADPDLRWLEAARAVVVQTLDLFWDEKAGTFARRARDEPPLAVPSGDDGFEGVLPSPEATLALVLVRLGAITGRADVTDRASKIVLARSTELDQDPAGAPTLIRAAALLVRGPRELVIAGTREAPATRALLREARARYLPDLTVAVIDPSDGTRAVELLGDLARDRGPTSDGRAQAFLCRGKTCRLPTSDPAALAKMLDER